MDKLNCRFVDLIRAAISVAIADGGFVIAIQISTFLLTYFGLSLQTNAIQTLQDFSKMQILISIISSLNLAVIIYRIAGLTRGIKYSALVCYQHTLRRWPLLILLHMLGSVALLLFINLLPRTSIATHSNLIAFAMFALIPFGIMACIFVIDQGKNPLQAIVATFYTVTNKISFRLILNLSMLYTLPFSLGMGMTSTYLAQYTGLINAVWFLFCHVVTIVMYAGTSVLVNSRSGDKKTTKVIII